MSSSIAFALALSPTRVDVEHLPPTVRERSAASSTPIARSPVPAKPARPLTAEQQARREELRALLIEHGGNISEVARRLGKERVQIRRWIKLFALSVGDNEE